MDEPLHQFRTIAAVPIQEDDDFARGVDGMDPGAARSAVPAAGFPDDSRPGPSSLVRGSIVAAVVDDDHLPRDLPRHRGDDAGDGGFFVQRRDDHRDPDAFGTVRATGHSACSLYERRARLAQFLRIFWLIRLGALDTMHDPLGS